MATGTATVKIGMAKMLKGGVIMDVVTPEQARIARSRRPARRGVAAGRASPFSSRLLTWFECCAARRRRRRAPWP